MRYAILLTFLLAGCAFSDSIDKVTGTTLEERCRDYRTALATAKALPETPDRAKRIRVYEAAIEACP